MTERLRVGVVGLGFGMAHLAAYQGLADAYEVVAVCDHGEDRIANARSWFGVPRSTTSFDELLAHEDLDVVDICTPPTTHVEYVERALTTGRHVICEKPLAPSLAAVDHLAAVAAACDTELMPVFQYRFGGGAARLRRLIELDLVGKPYTAAVETFWRRDEHYYESPWRGRLATELGGVCAMHAIHAYDLLLTLFGPARRVFARIATRVQPIETEDCAAVVVEFESGALATLSATLGSARETSRMRLHFEHLSAESGQAPYGGSAEPWVIEPASPDAARRIDEALASHRPGPELLDAQLAGFAQAITTGNPIPVTVADARPTIELLTAIYASAASGEPVAMPIEADHPAYERWAVTPPAGSPRRP